MFTKMRGAEGNVEYFRILIKFSDNRLTLVAVLSAGHYLYIFYYIIYFKASQIILTFLWNPEKR